MLDGVVGQGLRGFRGELVAEVEVRAAPDQLLVDVGEAVEVNAFFDVTLARIADPEVPTGCLIAQSAAQSPTLQAENGARVRDLLDAQHRRVRAALTDSPADPQVLDELATYVVAVNQSLAVLSRAGRPDPELRSVARLACTTVADTLARAASAS